jgi:amino acid adenylation domain-containing protein/HAD superfamily phosphatase (TIGR01681 family)
LCEFLQQKWNKKMLILSTFTSEYYLKSPLQYLIKNFSSETVDVKYVDTNLLIWLTKLHLSEEKNQTITILFRLIDLIDTNKKIDVSDLKENLNQLIQHVIEFKKNKKQALIVTLCPSPKFLHEEFKDLESYFLEEMQSNKIHTISQSDVRQHYALTDFDNKVEYETRIPYTFEFYIGLACLIARKLHCITHPSYKVIVVDCDNTLWTGIAGDIGPENVTFEKHNLALQEFLVKQDGIFICLCSKNEEETVNSVFSRKEVMILKMSDVAIKKINRDAKSSNIKAILNELKLANAKDTVFIDDNEDEIELVQQNFPEIFCILMPQTIEKFNKIWGFDINKYLSITQTDKDRLKLVQQEEALKTYYSHIKDPVESLKVKREKRHLVISKIEKTNENEKIEEEIEDKIKKTQDRIKNNYDNIIARITQIPTKTNQFNLFPFSSSPEKEWNLENMIKSNQIDCFIVTIQNKQIFANTAVEDQLKDNEDLNQGDLTALAVCKNHSDYLLVNGFFLSCRNTGLEVEFALMKHIAMYAESKKLDKIKIKFKKTEVNKLAETFINILCQEINKNSVNKKLNEEIILEFSSSALAQLDPYLLMRKTIESNAVNNNVSNIRLISPKDLGNAKLYLSSLQIETETLEPLIEKYFIGSKFKSIVNLNEKIIAKLKFLLPHQTKNFPQTISLVHLGLDSLKATHLSASVYEEEKIIIPIFKLLSHETTVLCLLDYIHQQKEKQSVIKKVPISHELNESCLPVSLQEQRIFFAEQNEGVINRYLMIACFSAVELNIACFKQASQKMIEHYDVFGSSFSINNGQLTKAIIPPESRIVNFKHEKINDESELMTAIHQEISQPLSMLSSNGLVKIIIYEVKASEEFKICLCVHHSISDAFTVNICSDTLSKFYNAASNSTLLKLPKALSYQEFTYQNNEKICDKHFQQEAKKFWSQHLSICEGVVEIPSDKSTISNFKPAIELKANRHEFELSLQDSVTLNQLASSNGVTVYSTIISFFSILISNYSFNERVSITTATSGRRPPFLATPGFFVNLLIHAFDLKENKSFRDFVVENHKNLINGIKFQDYPFSDIQKILNYNPLQNTALVYQSSETPKLNLNGKIAELVIPKRPIILDMREYCRFGNFTLFVQETPQGLFTFVIEYARDLFSLSFIGGFVKNFLYTIRSVFNNPNQRVQEISVVCDQERSQLISLGQGPQLNYAEDDHLVKRFQRSVEEYPNNTALCYGEICLSYKEVDQQATNLAHALFKAGVKQGNYVGIFLDADHLFFIAELAVLNIGAVFIPLSKENPNERLRLIINDANIKFFIVDDDTKDLFDTDFQTCQLISINSIEPTHFNKNLPLLVKTMEDRFCVLYTSGSTGKPKGVILQEKGIYRVVESPSFVEVLPGDKIAQTANQAFDAAQLECWLAWNHGACLVIFDKTTILNTSSLQRKLNAENITHMWLTAGLFDVHANNQPDLFKNLKYLMVGGDVVYKDTISKVLNVEKYPVIVNGYGPTETSIFALTYTFDKQTLSNFNSSPVGLPINETNVEILTPFGTLTPLGGIGTLSVTGQGVGSYLNLPKLESLRFTGTEKRSYLTGDLVMYSTKDPQIMFVGRENEQQVKIRGNLVSVEEVRACLLKYKGINQVEVLIKKIDEENQLVAFYNLDAQNDKVIRPTDQNLYDHLSKSLAPYMIPKFYIEIDAFTTNANGKLNRTQFQVLEAQLNTNFLEEIPPQTPNAIEIFNIVKKRLKRFPNSIKANFNSFGCDSIAMIEIINAINAKFKPEFLKKFKPEFEKKVKNKFKEDFEKYLSYKIFNANDLFKNPTVEGLENLLIKKLNDDANTKSLRMLKEGDSNLPAIVFIHPAGGGLSCFDKLQGQITFQNPCYGIEDPLLASNQSELLSMEQMANNYYDEIIKHLNIPIVLVGFSFGGLLACKIAYLFEDKKNNALLEVLLFDTWVVSCASQSTKNNLIKKVLQHCAKQREKANVDTVSSEVMRKLKELCEHHQSIGFECTAPKLYSTPVSLFKATNLKLETDFNDMNEDEENLNQSNYLLNFLDKKLFRKFEIPATHYDLLEAPDKNNLTEIFSKCINEINQKILLPYKLIKSNRSVFFVPLQTIDIENTNRLPDPPLHQLDMQLKH